MVAVSRMVIHLSGESGLGMRREVKPPGVDGFNCC